MKAKLGGCAGVARPCTLTSAGYVPTGVPLGGVPLTTIWYAVLPAAIVAQLGCPVMLMRSTGMSVVSVYLEDVPWYQSLDAGSSGARYTQMVSVCVTAVVVWLLAVIVSTYSPGPEMSLPLMVAVPLP